MAKAAMYPSGSPTAGVAVFISGAEDLPKFIPALLAIS
jgi:hypothetical protein